MVGALCNVIGVDCYLVESLSLTISFFFANFLAENMVDTGQIRTVSLKLGGTGFSDPNHIVGYVTSLFLPYTRYGLFYILHSPVLHTPIFVDTFDPPKQNHKFNPLPFF